MVHVIATWFAQWSSPLGILDKGNVHDDVIKWKHFPPDCHFVMWIYRSPVDSPHKDQWRGTFMFSLICAWTNGWANNRDAGDLRLHCAHYDVTAMHLNAFWILELVSSAEHMAPFSDMISGC